MVNTTTSRLSYRLPVKVENKYKIGNMSRGKLGILRKEGSGEFHGGGRIGISFLPEVRRGKEVGMNSKQ